MKTHRTTRILTASLLGALGLSLWNPHPPQAQADSWRDAQYWISDYGFDTAWETTRGQGVTVAVIDTGVDATHPDLIDSVVGGFDASGQGADDGTEPLGDDPDHGTMVASLIAGHGNNAQRIKRIEEANENLDDDEEPRTVPKPGPGADGITGTAPQAELLSVSINLGADATSTAEDQIAEGIIWAVDHGADVINISLSSSEQDWQENWDEAFLYAEQHDVVVVAAAGNRASGTTVVGAPATVPGVLTVAGVDDQRKISWDSSTEGITIGVAAPADPLVGATPGGGYAYWSGTSGAAPLVSGLAALIRSHYPDMPAHQVIQRILYTATDAGQEGTDSLYGHGIIDAEAALTAEVPEVDDNPMGSMKTWISLHRRGTAAEDTPRAEHTRQEPVQVPTEVPVASTQQRQGAVVQPLVLFGFSGMTVFFGLMAVFSRFRRRHKVKDRFDG